MDDAVALLCGYFRYVPPGSSSSRRSSSSGGGGGAELAAAVPEGSHAWDVEASLSDRHLARLVGVAGLALGQRGVVRTAGDFVDTGAVRTNADGTLDDPDESVCPLCVVL